MCFLILLKKFKPGCCSELKQAVDRKRRLGSTPNLESGRMPMRQMMGTEMNGNALHRQYQQPGLYASAQTMPYLTTSKPSLYNGQPSLPISGISVNRHSFQMLRTMDDLSLHCLEDTVK